MPMGMEGSIWARNGITIGGIKRMKITDNGLKNKVGMLHVELSIQTALTQPLTFGLVCIIARVSIIR